MVTKEEFAQSRSIEDSKAAYDLCKTIAQYCLLINGGAATAVVALLAKDKPDQSLLIFVPWGLAGYALGVVVSAFMLYCVMMMADGWNDHWYYLSYELDQVKADDAETSANKWQKRMNNTFGFAIACFAISCGVVAYGMAKVTPASVLPPAAITSPIAK
jgi:hypothetical protein